MTGRQRGQIDRHLERYPKAETVIFTLFPRLWRRARALGMTPPDIRSACHDGLMKAAAKWDGRFKFKTYVVKASRWQLLRVMARIARGLRTVDAAGQTVAGLPLRSILDVPERPNGPGRMERGEWRDLIAAFTRGLSGRKMRLLVGRFGLDGRPAQTLMELARSEGISCERVRAIVADTLLELGRKASELAKGHPGDIKP